jgi:hypothetical protein
MALFEGRFERGGGSIALKPFFLVNVGSVSRGAVREIFQSP